MKIPQTLKLLISEIITVAVGQDGLLFVAKPRCQKARWVQQNGSGAMRCDSVRRGTTRYDAVRSLQAAGRIPAVYLGRTCTAGHGCVARHSTSFANGAMRLCSVPGPDSLTTYCNSFRLTAPQYESILTLTYFLIASLLFFCTSVSVSHRRTWTVFNDVMLNSNKVFKDRWDLKAPEKMKSARD